LIFKMFLCDREIRKLIKEKDLISNYIDLETQLQMHGFDLTVRRVNRFIGIPTIDFNNSKRVISNYEPVGLSSYGNIQDAYALDEGNYLIEFNEVVKLPYNIKAIGIHRSSVIRCDCLTAMGNWDSGYHGRGITRLEVGKNGLILYKNARVSQLLFFYVDIPDKIYNGIYQKEGVK